MEIQWYPGHMKKALREMQENIKLVDLIIELLDARIPLSSQNPDLAALGAGKSRIVLLNKEDLAEPAATAAWAEHYRGLGMGCIAMDGRSKKSLKEVQAIIDEACRKKTERDRARGIINRPVRAMVVGIPNVGKSTFINSFAGKAAAKTGNKPGVTRGKQWIRLNKRVELLDTPGLLWPKFEDRTVGMHLAMIGSVRDEILPQEALSGALAVLLAEKYPGLLHERYDIPEEGTAEELLMRIAAQRGCLLKGGNLDMPRAAALLLEDFRSGRLGRRTLETVEDDQT